MSRRQQCRRVQEARDACLHVALLTVVLQAEAEAAEVAERQRLQALAEEVKQFNTLKLMQLTEQERQERYAEALLCLTWQQNSSVLVVAGSL